MAVITVCRDQLRIRHLCAELELLEPSLSFWLGKKTSAGIGESTGGLAHPDKEQARPERRSLGSRIPPVSSEIWER
jgi:hypothetical protein